MSFFDRLHRLKSIWPIVTAILVVDLVAMLYGWYYYVQVGQFDHTSGYFVNPFWWPLVSDSPNAVLLFWVALFAYVATGWRNKWLDAFAFILNVYVGLWTSMLFLMFPDHLGTWIWGSTNNILFFAHFGMPAQALILVRDLRRDPWSWREVGIIAGALLVYIFVDYVWPGFHPAPFLHGIDAALHIASPVLMVAVFAAFAAMIMTARAQPRNSPQ